MPPSPVVGDRKGLFGDRWGFECVKSDAVSKPVQFAAQARYRMGRTSGFLPDVRNDLGNSERSVAHRCTRASNRGVLLLGIVRGMVRSRSVEAITNAG